MTKKICQLNDSLFIFDDNTPEENGESATRNRQAKSKAGHENDPKRRTGIEKEISKSNIKANNHASAKDAGSSRAQKGTPCDSTLIDDISFMFDDHTPEKDSVLIVGRHQKKELDSGNRLKNHATSDKDASSVVTEQDPETSQLDYSDSSSGGDAGIDSDSESTESKGKKEMMAIKIPKTSVSTRNRLKNHAKSDKDASSVVTEQDPETSPLDYSDSSSGGDAGIDSDSESTESTRKKEMMAIIPKTSVSTRNAPKLSLKINNSKISNQRSRMITRGNKDPGIDHDQLIICTENETKSKEINGRKKEDGTSGIKTSSLTKARGLSSHKSQKGKLSTSDEISAQKCQKKNIVSCKKARSARLKATVDDIAHFVSGQQDPDVVQQQDDNLTQALS